MSDDKPSPTEDMVRKLLQLNPHLRGDGQSTKDVLATVTKATASTTPAPKPKSADVNLGAELDTLKRTHDLAVADLTKQQQALEKFSQTLAVQRKQARQTACARVIQAILAADPNLTQKKHQALLQAEKAFLSDVGFTPQRLLEAQKKR